MAERLTGQVIAGRTVFVAIAFVLVFLQLLPLNTTPSSWAPPDLLLACTLAWVSRRPDLLPVYVIAVIFLLTDFLFQRPPGLWTALVVILSEMLRARARNIRNVPLALEWGMIAVGIVAITVANRIVLAIVMIPQAPLGLTLIQMIMTIVTYPLVLLVAHFAFGVTRPAPGQTNNFGHRL